MAVKNHGRTDYRESDPMYLTCECGEYVRKGMLCDCGKAARDESHTHMARSVSEKSANYAVISEQIQWANETPAFERRRGTLRASVEATKAVAGLK